jgi:hypothetical protein
MRSTIKNRTKKKEEEEENKRQRNIEKGTVFMLGQQHAKTSMLSDKYIINA